MKSGLLPDKPVNIADKSGHLPDKPVNIAEKSGHLPDKSVTVKSGHLPDKPVTTPVTGWFVCLFPVPVQPDPPGPVLQLPGGPPVGPHPPGEHPDPQPGRQPPGDAFWPQQAVLPGQPGPQPQPDSTG